MAPNQAYRREIGVCALLRQPPSFFVAGTDEISNFDLVRELAEEIGFL